MNQLLPSNGFYSDAAYYVNIFKDSLNANKQRQEIKNDLIND